VEPPPHSFCFCFLFPSLKSFIDYVSYDTTYNTAPVTSPTNIPTNRPNTGLPSTQPALSIVEASDRDDIDNDNSFNMCQTVNGTIGALSGNGIDPFIATFTYELETLPSVTDQTVYAQIIPMIETAFGDHLVRHVLDESIMDNCAIIAKLQDKWEWLATLINAKESQSKLQQVEPSSSTEKEAELSMEEENKTNFRPNTDISAVGMSSKPLDSIEKDQQCQFKSKAENPCFVMLGQITLYLQKEINPTRRQRRQLVSSSRGKQQHHHHRGLQEEESTSYQDAVRAAIELWMNITTNFTTISPLLVRASYVAPEEETVIDENTTTSSRDVGSSSTSSSSSNDNDGVNWKILGGVLGGLFGTLLLLILALSIRHKNIRRSEQVSLIQQNAEITANLPPDDDDEQAEVYHDMDDSDSNNNITNNNNNETDTVPARKYVAPTMSSPVSV
jgi:hypothetical protein